MNAQFAAVFPRRETRVRHSSQAIRLALVALFLVCGFAIVVLGSPYFNIFLTNDNLAYQACLAALFLAASLWLKHAERWTKYWRVAFALFTASFAIVMTLLFGGYERAIMVGLNLPWNTSQWTAAAKLYEVLMITAPILVLNRVSGADLGSIYVKRGNWKLGLPIGLVVCANFGASAFLFFAARYTGLDALGAAITWGLVFSLANAFMEELWLRGIFLRHLSAAVGPGGAILVTSIVFSLMHGGASYLTPVATPFIVANTFTLGLACGYLTVKTDSLWCATLLHMASDFFLFIALLAAA